MKTIPLEVRKWKLFATVKFLAFITVLVTFLFSYQGNVKAFGYAQLVVAAFTFIAIVGMHPTYSCRELKCYKGFDAQHFDNYERKISMFIYLFGLSGLLAFLASYSALRGSTIVTFVPYFQFVCFAISALSFLMFPSAPLPEIWVDEYTPAID